MFVGYILCNLLGHNWIGGGWSSKALGNGAIPEGYIGHIYECIRCGCRTTVLETGKDMQARYDGYRAEHGEALINDDKYAPPHP